MADETTPRSVPYKDATPLLADPKALREQAYEDGYLFFKGLIDPTPILKLRQEILEILGKHGFLEPGVPVEKAQGREGFFIAESSSDPVYRDYYRDIQTLRNFHALPHHPDLIKVRSMVFDDDVTPHPLVILRTIFPNATEHTTPPHQEYYFIHGTVNTWTAWVPLGDCPTNLGSLAVWPGSHKRGFLPVEPSKGAGLITAVLPEEPVWAQGDFEVGDIVTFHSHTVHQGLPNYTEQTMRLSMDCRAQARSEKLIAPVSLEYPHLNPVDWDGVYEGWDADDELRYYWKEYGLTLEEDAPAPVGSVDNPHPGN